MPTKQFFSRAGGFTVTVLLLLALAAPVSAQTAAGAIAGTAEDASGGRLPGAKIAAIDDGKGERREAVSNSDGEFQITGLPYGKYRVEVTLNGFGKKTFNETRIEPNTPFSLKVTLAPAGVAEIVNISSEGQLRQTENSTQAATLTAKELTELPTASRNVTHLIVGEPGVSAPLPDRTSAGLNIAATARPINTSTRPRSLTPKINSATPAATSFAAHARRRWISA